MTDATPPAATWDALQDNQTAEPEPKGVLKLPEAPRGALCGSKGEDEPQDPIETEDDALRLMQERLARADLLPWPSNHCDAVNVGALDSEPRSEQQSGGSVSSLSSVSQLSTSSRPDASISSLDMGSAASSDTPMIPHHQYRYSPQLPIVSGGDDLDALGLDESVSTGNGAIEGCETLFGDDDSCSLPSSISSISSLSSTLSRPRARTRFAPTVGDCIDNIPRPVAQDRSNGDDGDERSAVRFWRVEEFVQPEVLSSLSSTSDLDLDMDASDASDPDDANPQLIEFSEQRHGAVNLDPDTTPSPQATPHPSSAYDAYVGFYELRNVFHALFPHRDARILDVGCGTSSVCRQLVLHGFSNIHGLDSSAPAIAFQKQETAELTDFVRFLEMDAAAMDFPDSHFCGVVTKAVLDRLASIQENEFGDSKLLQVLREFTRCLCPGGLWISVSCQDHESFEVADADSTKVSWWSWASVKRFIAVNYIPVKTYQCGVPLVHCGALQKPFVIQIHRKCESRTQQLERWASVTRKTKQLQREVDIRDKWRCERQRQCVDLQVAERELPDMLTEDQRSILVNSRVAYERSWRQRAKTRVVMYVAQLLRERMDMEEEDAQGECARIVSLLVVQHARRVVLECIEAAMCSSTTSASERSVSAAATSDVSTTALPPTTTCNEDIRHCDGLSDAMANAPAIANILNNAVSRTNEVKQTPPLPGETPAQGEANCIAEMIVRDAIAAAMACVSPIRTVSATCANNYAEITSSTTDDVSASSGAEADSSSEEMTFPEAEVATSSEPPSRQDGSAPPADSVDTTIDVGAQSPEAESRSDDDCATPTVQPPCKGDPKLVNPTDTAASVSVLSPLDDETCIVAMCLQELVNRVPFASEDGALETPSEGEPHETPRVDESNAHTEQTPVLNTETVANGPVCIPTQGLLQRCEALANTENETHDDSMQPTEANMTSVDATCEVVMKELLDQVCLADMYLVVVAHVTRFH